MCKSVIIIIMQDLLVRGLSINVDWKWGGYRTGVCVLIFVINWHLSVTKPGLFVYFFTMCQQYLRSTAKNALIDKNDACTTIVRRTD